MVLKFAKIVSGIWEQYQPAGISRIYKIESFFLPLDSKKGLIDMEKMSYIEAELELAVLNDEDIVVTSGIDMPPDIFTTTQP